MIILFWTLIASILLLTCLWVIVPLTKFNTGTAIKYKKFNYLLALFIALIISIVSLLLYMKWGDVNGLNQYYAQQKNEKATKVLLAKLKTPQDVINKLKQRLAEDPDSARGWYLLGRLYFTMGQFHQAVTAFQRAYQLQPSDQNTMMQLAEALYFEQGKSLKGQAQQLLDAVLASHPNNQAAINLVAINAYNLGHYKKAIVNWEQLLNEINPQSADGKVLLDAIAKAQKKLENQKTLN